MTSVGWDPKRYGHFASERSTPFFDLVSRIGAESPRRVVDLGCGPGTLTTTLAERWPNAEVVGFDSSAEMLEVAEAAPDRPANLRFEQGDIAEWMPGESDDVVVTNAALQWVPGHRELLPRWLNALPPGAWFAMQVPGNFRSPSHTLMRGLAESENWRDRLGGVLRHEDAVAEPADYLELFLQVGFRAQAWETSYLHLLHGADPVLDWVRGSGLRPVLAALAPEDAAAFEGEYAALLRTAYPATERGTVYSFRRIFCVGMKEDESAEAAAKNSK